VFGPDGYLYATDDMGKAILRYNGSTGAFIDAFVPAATSGLNIPLVAALGPDGKLYVGDYLGNNTGVVRKYNGTTGASMRILTSGAYVMEKPHGLVFGSDGNLYVADYADIVKYNGVTGAFMSIFVPSSSLILQMMSNYLCAPT